MIFVPVDPSLPIELLTEEAQLLPRRHEGLGMAGNVVIQAGGPGLGRTDDQEVREHFGTPMTEAVGGDSTSMAREWPVASLKDEIERLGPDVGIEPTQIMASE